MSKPYEFHYNPDKKNPFYRILRPFTKALCKFLFRVKVVGLENIPQSGGFILASNHLNALDPVLIIHACPRELHFMGKSSLFHKAFPRFFLTIFNGFPIRREGLDSKAIHYAEELLKRDHCLGIFPEGTRSKNLRPAKAKGGVAMIAKDTHSDVLPVSIYFDSKAHFRSKVTIRFGELIAYESLGLVDEERNTQQLRDAAAAIMERIVALWERKHEA